MIDNTPWGVLDLNFPATRFREAKSVGRWFFDEMGNVTTQPVGGEISGSVNDHRLLLRIMDKAEDEAIRATLGDGPK